MHGLFSQLVYFFKIISNIPLTTVVIQNHVMLVRFQSSSPYDVNFEFRNILNTQSRAYYRSKKIRTFSIHNFHSFIELCFENEITKMKKNSCCASFTSRNVHQRMFFFNYHNVSCQNFVLVI